ncbi:MAG: glycosyltransferase [Gemmatimonadetes bacterium]|nr:glycosyltransferase [Gemmatimonadota bacterium]
MSERAIVSVLVPAKDEAENLPEFLRQCAEALPRIGAPAEVVVVDDGSRDATPQVLAQLQAQYSFLRVVTHRRQRGIADALRSAGMRPKATSSSSTRPTCSTSRKTSRSWSPRSWPATPTS